MADATYKCTARYRDAVGGLCWSINSYYFAADINTVKAAFNLWNTKYLGACHENVTLIEWFLSDVDVVGDRTVFPASAFTTQNGVLSNLMLPASQALLVTGRNNDPFAGIGRWEWKLHGLDSSLLNADGTFKIADAKIADILTQSEAYLWVYRKNATTKHGWNAIVPAAAAGEYGAAGPYVRRLGSGFYLPGQRHRYR